MTVAARRPERVAGLVIVGASGEPVGLRSLGYRLLGAAFQHVPVGVLERTNRWYFARRYPAVAAEPILAAGFSFRGGAAAVRSLVGERFRPRLAAYPGPTLIVNGELDLFFRPTARSFAAVAADARRVVIPRATHLVNLDQPEAFSRHLRRFARDVSVRNRPPPGPTSAAEPATPPPDAGIAR
jgi:pimeloyl-ACP methyl ester carboxylesterase